MKYIIMADLHFMNKDLEVKVNAFNKAMKYAKENGYVNIIIAGDVYDTRSAVSTKVKTTIERMFSVHASNGLKFFIGVGNHDCFSYLLPDVNSLNSLRYIEGIKVYDEPTVDVIDGEKFAFIPYEHKLDKFKETFIEMSKDVHAVVAHIGVDEAKSAGMPDTGLNVNFFSMYSDAYVYCGDYHKGIHVGKFLSPGCMIQDDFGDAGMDKGFWTFEDGLLEFVKADYPEFLKMHVESMSEIRGVKFGGKHMWFVTGNAKLKKKLEDRCEKDGAVSCRVSIVKEFKPAHEQVIEIAEPSAMFDNCLKIRKPANGELQADLFHRICVKGETYADTLDSDFDISSFIDAVNTFMEESKECDIVDAVDDFDNIGDPITAMSITKENLEAALQETVDLIADHHVEDHNSFLGGDDEEW